MLIYITLLFLSVLAIAEATCPRPRCDTICNADIDPLPCVCAGTCAAEDVPQGALCFGDVMKDCHGTSFRTGTPLGGTIPTGFGDLADLLNVSLTFAENYISGTIPDDFGRLTNLKALSIFDTNLSGTLPASLGNLDQLTHCNLSGNWACPIPKLPAACGEVECHAPSSNYVCHVTTSQCVADPLGDFTSKADCTAKCVSPKYACQITTKTCVEDPYGEFPGLANCTAKCI